MCGVGGIPHYLHTYNYMNSDCGISICIFFIHVVTVTGSIYTVTHHYSDVITYSQFCAIYIVVCFSLC